MTGAKTYTGPADTFGPSPGSLTPRVFITSGRAALVESVDDLILIDPGDESILQTGKPAGPLSDLLSHCDATGKKLGRILITHSHPDHVANLAPLLEYGKRDVRIGRPLVIASEKTRLAADIKISTETVLDQAIGLRAIPVSGHSQMCDDLAFFLADGAVLFPGDLVQPKGETWENAFYPSPYPYFTDGGAYLDSLRRLASLDFVHLVTGHREIRSGPLGREWLDTTMRAIRTVSEEVALLTAGGDFISQARDIFIKMARSRGIEDEIIQKRMSPPGDSAFDRFDLPGIIYFMKKRFPGYP